MNGQQGTTLANALACVRSRVRDGFQDPFLDAADLADWLRSQCHSAADYDWDLQAAAAIQDTPFLADPTPVSSVTEDDISDRNETGILTGKEDPADFCNYLATIIESAMVDGGGFAVQPLRSIRVTDGFQPYLTIELTNGAEWQLTPVRSSRPTDGAA